MIDRNPFLLWLLAAGQAGGIAVSIILAATAFYKPEAVEAKLRSLALAKVEAAVGEMTPGADDSMGRFKAMASAFGEQAAQTDAIRVKLVHALIAQSRAKRCEVDCGFWAVAAVAVNGVLFDKARKLRIGQTNLQEFAIARYERAVDGLLTDLMRFGVVTAVALSLALCLVFVRGWLSGRFIAFSAAMTAYAGWAAYGYFFNQNWAMTIILNDWAAPGYQIAMVLVSALFADWVFLRGRITEFVGNAITAIIPG